ncbi:galactose mutarotase-like isoform X1 [Dreissena polymorpha]|uniref:galactose mutarotase-like isoform X1 n=1 Tax=Dreissena polymorpha TaxID=45954 RepID=UPI0022643F02|nr:galactose mutarotase-like isoform X1 [Dreissena polymorpha]
MDICFDAYTFWFRFDRNCVILCDFSFDTTRTIEYKSGSLKYVDNNKGEIWIDGRWQRHLPSYSLCIYAIERAYTLKNRQNLEARIIDYGGRITHLFVPDQHGKLEDIVLGYDSYKDGYDKDEFYLGALIGRYANRIAKGQFSLDGVTYQLGINNGPNTNHGGFRGFDKRLWGSTIEDDKLVLTYTSADLEEGFPGEVNVTVTFALTDENELVIAYRATTTKPTVINLTSHPYFNLAGHSSGDLKGHVIRIPTGLHTPSDSNQIPTGEFDEGKDTVLDLRQSTEISEALEHVPRGYGYDHNFALMNPGIKQQAANVRHAPSGRVLDMYTTEPGMQFYTGYWLDIPRGKGGAHYGKWSGFCLEAQKYPDSPNKPHFPSAVIRPDETYQQTTKYVFSTMEL